MEIKQSKIWERILETGDLEELNFLLHLVLNDEESIIVILNKLSKFVKEESSISFKVSGI